MKTEEEFWSKRYEDKNIAWDIGYPSTPLKEYIDQLEDKNIRILIPGAGNAYEAEYLFNEGFKNVFVLDISQQPLKAFQKRVPNFPSDQLLHGNFFELEDHFDLIIEQTFFCSFEPSKENRMAYAKKMSEIIRPNGTLAGLWFKHSLEKGGPPYGGNKEEYLGYFNPYFKTKIFENCHNSISPRAGNELFGIFIKK